MCDKKKKKRLNSEFKSPKNQQIQMEMNEDRNTKNNFLKIVSHQKTKENQYSHISSRSKSKH